MVDDQKEQMDEQKEQGDEQKEQVYEQEQFDGKNENENVDEQRRIWMHYTSCSYFNSGSPSWLIHPVPLHPPP